MFVDRAKITIISGKGGNGAVTFRREPYVPEGGPDGGDGGKGGDVIFKADRNLRTLMDFRYKRKYEAQNGQNGRPSRCFGKSGENTIILVPGTSANPARAAFPVSPDVAVNITISFSVPFFLAAVVIK